MTGTRAELEMIDEAVTGLLARTPPGAADGYDPAAWRELEEAGFAHIGSPEAAGGAGGSLAEAMAAVEAAARAATMVPLAETCVLAGWALAEGNLPITPGALASAVAPEGFLGHRGDAWRARGELSRVAYGLAARRVVVLGEAEGREWAAELDPSTALARPGTNLAGEPRDTLVFDDVPLAAERVVPVPDGTARRWEQRLAVARSVMMGGAAQSALDLTLRHIKEREQFGRPLARFQAVQQMVAEMAGAVVLLQSAARAAVRSLDGGSDPVIAVAAAKAQASLSAGTVARLAHQLYGAMGLTHESSLRYATTRLWSWREEAGGEHHWAEVLGGALTSADPADAWALITGAG